MNHDAGPRSEYGQEYSLQRATVCGFVRGNKGPAKMAHTILALVEGGLGAWQVSAQSMAMVVLSAMLGACKLR
jgi:hypothetical protein